MPAQPVVCAEAARLSKQSPCRCPLLFPVCVCPQILFTAELNRRLSAAGVPVDALCLHPGNVLTEVVRSLPPLIQTLYRALLTNVLFTPQEGETQGGGCRERAAPAARRQQAGAGVYAQCWGSAAWQQPPCLGSRGRVHCASMQQR